MQKILSIFLIGVFSVNGFGVFGLTEQDAETQFMLDEILISDPEIRDVGEYVLVNLEEAESSLLIPGEPILPVIIKKFTFPLGTRIVDVAVDV